MGSILSYSSGTFTRTTEGSYRTGLGQLAWAGSNVLRYDLGVPLFEGASTNLIRSEGVSEAPPATEDGSTPGWYYTAGVGVGSLQAAPDGRSVARRFDYDVNQNIQITIDPGSITAATHTISAWVREVSGDSSDNLALTLREGGSVVTQDGIDTASASWRRFQVSGSTDLDPDSRLQLRDINGSDYTIDVGLLQHEQLPFASSYIRSTSARGADVLSFSQAQSPETIRSGRWRFDFYPLFDSTQTISPAGHYLIGMPGLAVRDFVYLSSGNVINVRIDNSDVASVGPITYSRDQKITVSVDMGAGGLQVVGATSGNGSASWTVGTQWDDSNGIYVGARAGGGDPAFCRISEPRSW